MKSWNMGAERAAPMLDTPNRDATRPIASIKIGNRHRHDLGNVGPLAASINDIGLLHPVVIRPDGTLIELVAGSNATSTGMEDDVAAMAHDLGAFLHPE